MADEKNGGAEPKNPDSKSAGAKDKPVEKSDGPTPAGHAATETQPCCCNYQLCLEYVNIVEPTGKFISSLFDDHVFMQVTDCKNNTKEFPKDPKHQKLGKGKHVWTENLAVVESNKTDECKIDCTIAIQVRKEALFNRILDEIVQLEGELSRALAKLAKDTDTLRQILALVPVGGALQKAIGDIIADQQLIDSITAKIAALAKTLAGTDDTLMREIGVVFAGYAPCSLQDGTDWLDNILEPRGWKKDGVNQNRATLDVEIKAHDGEWHLGLAVYRICPMH